MGVNLIEVSTNQGDGVLVARGLQQLYFGRKTLQALGFGRMINEHPRSYKTWGCYNCKRNQTYLMTEVIPNIMVPYCDNIEKFTKLSHSPTIMKTFVFISIPMDDLIASTFPFFFLCRREGVHEEGHACVWMSSWGILNNGSLISYVPVYQPPANTVFIQPHRRPYPECYLIDAGDGNQIQLTLLQMNMTYACSYISVFDGK